MMQAKKVLGLLLLGSFLLSDGILNASKKYKFVTGDRKGEMVDIPASMVLSGTGRAKDETVYAYLRSQGGEASESQRRGQHQERHQNQTPPPPVSRDVPMNAAAAIQAALDCLQALTTNLVWNGKVISSHDDWKAFIDGVAEAYRAEMAEGGPAVRTNRWKLGEDFKIVLAR